MPRKPPCSPTQMVNPKTGYCVEKSGIIGRRLCSTEVNYGRFTKKDMENFLQQCKVKSPAKSPAKVKSKILNPKTGKYVDRDGKIGKSILAKPSSRASSPRPSSPRPSSPKPSSPRASKLSDYHRFELMRLSDLLKERPSLSKSGPEESRTRWHQLKNAVTMITPYRHQLSDQERKLFAIEKKLINPKRSLIIMKCAVCSSKCALSGHCRYCDKNYCSAHRLPEEHQCSNIEQCKKDAHDRNKKLVESQSVISEKLIKI